MAAYFATEVTGDERRLAVGRYLETSTYRPTVHVLSTSLPDPDDHPVFRIDRPTSPDA